MEDTWRSPFVPAVTPILKPRKKHEIQEGSGELKQIMAEMYEEIENERRQASLVTSEEKRCNVKRVLMKSFSKIPGLMTRSKSYAKMPTNFSNKSIPSKKDK